MKYFLILSLCFMFSTNAPMLESRMEFDMRAQVIEEILNPQASMTKLLDEFLAQTGQERASQEEFEEFLETHPAIAARSQTFKALYTNNLNLLVADMFKMYSNVEAVDSIEKFEDWLSENAMQDSKSAKSLSWLLISHLCEWSQEDVAKIIDLRLADACVRYLESHDRNSGYEARDFLNEALEQLQLTQAQ